MSYVREHKAQRPTEVKIPFIRELWSQKASKGNKYVLLS